MHKLIILIPMVLLSGCLLHNTDCSVGTIAERAQCIADANERNDRIRIPERVIHVE